MSRRTKREMAPPPHETGFAPHETGRFAPSVIQVPTTRAVLGSGLASTGGQAAPWWTGPLPQATSSAVTSTNCGMDYYPPRGFMSLFQSGQPLFSHVSAPWPPMGKKPQLAPPKTDSGNQNSKKRSKGKNIISLEDGNEGRTAKHLVFDPDEDYKEGPFTVEHCWKILRDEPKWHAVLEELENPNKRSLDGEDEAIDTSRTPEAVGELEHPMGTHRAKKKRNGKGRVSDDDVSLDEDLKKFIGIQAATKKTTRRFSRGTITHF